MNGPCRELEPLQSRLRAAIEPLLGDRAEPFLAAGLTALARNGAELCWVQLGLTPRGADWRYAFAELDRFAADLLADPQVANVFFMRKPPGIRLRFEVARPRRSWWAGAAHARLGAAGGPFDPVSRGVYEPEQHLFGGPASMPHVHRLFTIDSRAWLAFHRLPAPPPGWVISLLLVREVLAGAGVVGWEDLDVWERIRTQAGRTLPAGLTSGKLAAAGAGIRAGWADPQRLLAGLSAPAADAVETWGPRLRAAAAQWRDGYLAGPDATIGAREAVAFATIFHWNRGGLPAGTQALIASALADRSARP